MTSLTISTILRSNSAKFVKLNYRNFHQFLSPKCSYTNSHILVSCRGVIFRNHLPPGTRNSLQKVQIAANCQNHRFNYSTSSTPISSSSNPTSDSNEEDKLNGEKLDNANSDQVEGLMEDFEGEEMSLTLTEEQTQQLTNGDPEILKKIRYIQLEHEILRQEGIKVPSKPISLSKWQELLLIKSKSGRRKYYLYLFKIEKSNEHDLLKKEEKKKQRIETLSKLPQLPPLGGDPDGVIYGLNRNTLWMRLYDTTVNTFFHHKLIQEMQFGQPLVIDCGYSQYMTYRESKNCAAQLEMGFSANRCHPAPFDLHFCNADREDSMIKYFNKKIPPLFDPDFPTNITDKSYLDVFPKDKLVYLSPHAHEELLEWSPDDIYIIGAMVDRTDPRPFSLAKAKKENLRIKKLPLDNFLDWGLGNKSLTLDQMVNIMLDARHYRDWNKAFEHVPKRKLRYYGKTNFDDDDNFDRRNMGLLRGKIDAPRFFKRPQPGYDRYQNEEDDNQHDRKRNYGSVPRFERQNNEYGNNERNNKGNNYNRGNYQDDFERGGDRYNRNNSGSNCNRGNEQESFDRSNDRNYRSNSNFGRGNYQVDAGREFNRNAEPNNYRDRKNADYGRSQPKSRTNVRAFLEDPQ